MPRERVTVALEVVEAQPPNIDAIRAWYGGELPGGAVFAHGGTLYSPGGGAISEDLAVHEATHAGQQSAFGDVGAWWDRYLADPEFRLSQEAEAYRNQLTAYCRREKDRNARARFLMRIAAALAGPMYRLSVTQAEARARIIAGR